MCVCVYFHKNRDIFLCISLEINAKNKRNLVCVHKNVTKIYLGQYSLWSLLLHWKSFHAQEMDKKPLGGTLPNQNHQHMQSCHHPRECCSALNHNEQGMFHNRGIDNLVHK